MIKVLNRNETSHLRSTVKSQWVCQDLRRGDRELWLHAEKWRNSRERMASAPLWPSTRGRSIDSPSVRHTASPTEACWSTGPGISRGVQGAPLHHGVSRRWNELSPATRSMADIRASSCRVWRMEGGEEGERASGSYYLHLAVRNHGVMHYMCSPLCSVCKGGTNRGERDEKCSFRSIRLTYTAVFSRTGGSVPPHFCL